jgi:hypothetical protein
MLHCLFVLVVAAIQFGQSNTGELRLNVTDPAGLPLPGAVEIVSEANQFRRRCSIPIPAERWSSNGFPSADTG